MAWGCNQEYGELTRPLWELIRDATAGLLGHVRVEHQPAVCRAGKQYEALRQLRVSGDFFQVLGVQPFRGRLLMPEDERACPVSRAVVSYAYWQSELGGRELGTAQSCLPK